MPPIDYSVLRVGTPAQVTNDCIGIVRRIREETTFNMGQVDDSQLPDLAGLGNTRKVYILYRSDSKADVTSVRNAISRALMLSSAPGRPGTPPTPAHERPPFYLYVAV